MFGIKTFNDLYLWARKELRQAGIDDSSNEARLMISAASKKTKEEFLRDLKLYALGGVEEKTAEMLKRRLSGEPLAYVTGEWEFMSNPIEVDDGVLIPRADTEVMAELAVKMVRGRSGECRVLDLCSGSGCIGIAIASAVPTCRVILADNSMKALRVSRRNVIRNNVQRNVTCVAADAKTDPAMLLGKFDLIVCNPPYIPTAEIKTLDASVRDFEPREALDGGEDGLDFYRVIIPKWTKILKENGCMMFECGEGQADIIMALMKSEGYRNVAKYKDTAGTDRVVAGVI